MDRGEAAGADLAEAACFMGLAPSCADAVVFLEKRDPERAFRIQSHGCSELRDTFGCVNLGVLLADGTGTSPDPARALKLYRSACDHRDGRGCRYLGNSLRDERFGATKPDEAVAAYAAGCKAGDARSCELVPVAARESGRPLPIDDESAWLRASCTEANPTGCTAWGIFLMNLERPYLAAFASGCKWRAAPSCAELSAAALRADREVEALERAREACGYDGAWCFWYGAALSRKRDFVAAAQTWEAACGQGEARSCRALGIAYLQGQGRDLDVARAQSLLQKACDLKDGRSCESVGVLFLQGKLVPRDLTAARASFEDACKKGACRALAACEADGVLGKPNKARARQLYEQQCTNSPTTGCVEAGVMAREGQGGPRDLGRAASLFSRGCNAKDDWSCNMLAYLTIAGEGVQKNIPRAFELWESASKTLPEAHDSIGEAHEKGLGGIPKNLPLAYELYLQACNAGVRESCANAARVAKAVRKPAPKAPPPPASDQGPRPTQAQRGGLALPDLTGIINSF